LVWAHLVQIERVMTMGHEIDLSKLAKMELPKIDLSSLAVTTANVRNVQSEIEQSTRAIEEMNRKEYQRKEQVRQATVETAENTAEMKADLKNVIHNQNEYITILKEQNEYIKQVLNNMFGSSEDSVIVQKEILKIMQELKPTDGLVADKGLDVVIQLVFNAVQLYLKSKGIFF